MVTGVSVLTILPYAVYISMPAKAAFPDLDFFRPHSIHKVQFLECFWGFTEFDPRAACVLSDHSVPLDKQQSASDTSCHQIFDTPTPLRKVEQPLWQRLYA